MSTDELAERCLKLFRDGHDTKTIASAVGKDEADVERALHIAMEAQRRNQQQEKR